MMKVTNTYHCERKSFSGPLFTGPDVTLQTLLLENEDYDLNVVNFGKGVRHRLHVHDCEQILVVTAGKGIVATETEQRTVIPGDVIFFSAGEKH